jgi:hypothetical protein
LVTTRLTAEELQIVRRRAEMLGLSCSDYLRLAAIGFIPHAHQPPLPVEIFLASHPGQPMPQAVQRVITKHDDAMQRRFKSLMGRYDSEWQKYLLSLRKQRGGV